jgi:hypothetical protein
MLCGADRHSALRHGRLPDEDVLGIVVDPVVRGLGLDPAARPC